MSQRPTWLRRAHRAHAGITVLAVLVLLILNRTGALSAGQGLRLFLLVEIPLLLLFVVSTVLRFRKAGPAAGDDLLGRLEEEEPLLRPVFAELRSFQSLVLLIAGKQRVPVGAIPFGYTKGTMTFPGVMVALSVVELVVVHILVPWQWVRIVLLILTVWGVLFILGLFATRMVYPHFVTDDALHLRWGHQSVLVTSRMNVIAAHRHANHAHMHPHVTGEQLILTQFQSTNVRIRFAKPVRAAPPISKKYIPTDFHTSEVQLHVDDPDAFLDKLRLLPEEGYRDEEETGSARCG